MARKSPTRNVDTAICQMQLQVVMADVKKFRPGIKHREAWVYKVGKDHWEFHFGEYYWHGSAGNAYEARANGWSAWLEKNGVEGYKR